MKNSINLIGYLGANPELLKSEKGTQYAKFSIATSSSYKKKEGEKVEKTEWHDCIAYNKLAELVSNILVKGSLVDIVGMLTYSSYEKNDVTIKKATIKVI